VFFRDELTGSDYGFAVPGTGAGAFAGQLFAGSYSVRFTTTADTDLVGLPVDKTAIIASGVALETDQASLSYDLEPRNVGGTVTVNHAVMPDSPAVTSRGSVVYHALPSGDEYSFPVSATGEASYGGKIFAGTYDVDFVTVDDPDLVGLPVHQGTRLASRLPLIDETPYGYDLQPLTATGTLTLNGAPMPESPLTAYRGKVIFHDLASGTFRELWVTPTGAASFSGLVFAGEYEVLFRTVPDPNLVGLPLDHTLAVGRHVDVTSAAPLAFDVRTVSIAGTLTATGGALPDSPGTTSRGTVVFRDRESGQKYSVPLAPTGPGAFSTELFASRYAVTFETSAETGLVGLPTDATAHLALDTDLSSSANVQYDVQPVAVSGAITLAGAPLPSSPAVTTRGNAIFQERFTRSGYGFGLGATGDAQYAGLLFAGSYAVELWTTSDPDLLGLPRNSATLLDVGCMPKRQCDKSASDLSGLWTFMLEGLGEFDASLSHENGMVSGLFHGEADGVFSSIELDGDALTLFTHDYCNPLGIAVTLVDACTLVGTAYCTDPSNEANFRQALGVR
jgi:hypothetical protein